MILNILGDAKRTKETIKRLNIKYLMPDIKKIVLTGGPCAGKTTALVKITEYFSGFGYKVFNVPEVPTIYSAAGWNYLTPNRKLYYQGERAMCLLSIAPQAGTT